MNYFIENDNKQDYLLKRIEQLEKRITFLEQVLMGKHVRRSDSNK